MAAERLATLGRPHEAARALLFLAEATLAGDRGLGPRRTSPGLASWLPRAATKAICDRLPTSQGGAWRSGGASGGSARQGGRCLRPWLRRAAPCNWYLLGGKNRTRPNATSCACRLSAKDARGTEIRNWIWPCYRPAHANCSSWPGGKPSHCHAAPYSTTSGTTSRAASPGFGTPAGTYAGCWARSAGGRRPACTTSISSCSTTKRDSAPPQRSRSAMVQYLSGWPRRRRRWRSPGTMDIWNGAAAPGLQSAAPAAVP